jgi:hypothetical protein
VIKHPAIEQTAVAFTIVCYNKKGSHFRYSPKDTITFFKLEMSKVKEYMKDYLIIMQAFCAPLPVFLKLDDSSDIEQFCLLQHDSSSGQILYCNPHSFEKSDLSIGGSRLGFPRCNFADFCYYMIFCH